MKVCDQQQSYQYHYPCQQSFLSTEPSKMLCKPPESQEFGQLALPMFIVGIHLISLIKEASEKNISLPLNISNDVF